MLAHLDEDEDVLRDRQDARGDHRAREREELKSDPHDDERRARVVQDGAQPVEVQVGRGDDVASLALAEGLVSGHDGARRLGEAALPQAEDEEGEAKDGVREEGNGEHHREEELPKMEGEG